MPRVYLKNTISADATAEKPRISLYDQLDEKTKKKLSAKHLPKKMRKRSKRLTKLWKRDAAVKLTNRFIHTRLNNICLSDKSDSVYSTFSGGEPERIKKSTISNVLINAGHDFFYRLPYAVFKKLCKIQYMVIKVEINIREDGMTEEDEPFMFMGKSYNIASINQLFDYLMLRNGLYESLGIYQSEISWYSTMEMTETAEILYDNGESKKMPMSEFLGKYNL